MLSVVTARNANRPEIRSLVGSNNEGEPVADAVGKAERINFVPAIKHGLGKARTAKEHSDHRPVLGTGATKRDQFPRHGIGFEIVGPRERDQPFERLDRIAFRAEVERDEVGLAAWKHRDGGRLLSEMAAIVELGERGLHGSVTTVQDEHLRPDSRDDSHRLADLARFFDLVVEDVGVAVAIFADSRQLSDVARRFRVGQQSDARPFVP